MKKVNRFRTKVIRAFVGFLIGMMVCSAISRGIYAYQMPQVTVTAASSGVLSHEIVTDGLVKARSQKAVVTVAGVRVREVCVEIGDKVKRGDVLFRLDTTELQTKVNSSYDEIMEWEQELQKRERERRQRVKDREREKRDREKQEARQKKRQREDLKRLDIALRQNIQKAKEKCRTAEREFSRYPSWEQYWQEAQQDSQEYVTLRAAAEKAGAAKEDQEAFAVFLPVFERRIKKEWQQGRQALQESCRSAKEAWRDAKEERKETLTSQKRQNRRINEDDRLGRTDHSDDVDTKGEDDKIRKRIAQKRRALEKQESLLRQNGRITCRHDGIVEQVAVSVGEYTPEGASIVCSDASKGFRFLTEISGEQRNYVAVGDLVDLSFQGGKVVQEGVAVTSITHKENGNYEVSAVLKDDQVVQGETGTMKVKAESARYDCYIPISSLYAAGADQYVLVLREQDTFLGTEYSVEKRVVDVVDKNDRYAALKGSPLEAEEQIVTAADREIRPGVHVRMQEE